MILNPWQMNTELLEEFKSAVLHIMQGQYTYPFTPVVQTGSNSCFLPSKRASQ